MPIIMKMTPFALSVMAKKRFSRIQSKPHHDLKSRFWKGNNGRVFGFEIITLAILSHRNGGGGDVFSKK